MTAATILVVEDNPATRKMLRVALEAEGFAVVTAADARGALEAAARALPDLVILDLVLPDLGGGELLARFRTLPGADEVPVLALSGFLGRLDEMRAAEAGFSALLVKPIEPSRLIEVIATYLPPPRRTSAPVRGARVLVVDDDPVALKLLRVHLVAAGHVVLAATSAEQALAKASADPPDVIVSDVLMPGTDGFELCMQLRRVPALARIPVVLLSASYAGQADLALARRAGASTLVIRSPSYGEAVAAVAAVLERSPAPPAEPPSESVRLEHANAIAAQLERQLAINAGLARRAAIQGAQLSMLASVADALARGTDAGPALEEVLAAILDASGISKGALYLREAGGALALRHSIGFTDGERAALAGGFGRRAALDAVIARGARVAVPSRAIDDDLAAAVLAGAGVASAHLVPLVAAGGALGAIFLGAVAGDVAGADAFAIVGTIAKQLVLSLELTDAFARVAASERRHRTVLENANDAIALLDADGVVREVNPRWTEITGLPRERLIGRRLDELTAPGQGEPDRAACRRVVETGQPQRARLEIAGAGGATVVLDLSYVAMGPGGDAILSIGRDMTEHERVHAQLMVSDRLASVGALAAGIAHEINNPLSVVMANAELAAREVARLARTAGAIDVEDLVSEIADAQKAAEDVRDIVRDVKMFARAEDDRQGPVDVGRVIDSTLRMMRNEIKHRAELITDLAPVPRVLANEARLGQVFLNLLVNAVHAIPEDRAALRQVRVRCRHRVAARQVVVEIEDTGAGIPPALRRTLFSPLFATGPGGAGTGLGLVVCDRVVAALGGTIEVDSELGRGTIMRVILPSAAGEGEPAIPPALAPRPRPRGAVLIVDDDAAVGASIARMLEGAHDVTRVTDPADAVAMIRGGRRFDVILCDVMMPNMTGEEVLAALGRVAPDQAARVVFMTGGAFTPRARAFLDRIANPVVEKPVDLRTLFAAVEEGIRRARGQTPYT